MKRTPWFPVSVKPVRVGWYETRICQAFTVQRWFDGNNFRYSVGGSVCGVFQLPEGSGQWRGLTEPAK